MLRRASRLVPMLAVSCAGGLGTASPVAPGPMVMPIAASPEVGPRPAWVEATAFVARDHELAYIYAVGANQVSLAAPSCGSPRLRVETAENRARAELTKFLRARVSRGDGRATITESAGSARATEVVSAWFDGEGLVYVLVRQRGVGSVGEPLGPRVDGGYSPIHAMELIRAAARFLADGRGACADPFTRAKSCCAKADLYCDDPTRFNRIIGNLCRCGYEEPCLGGARCVGTELEAACVTERPAPEPSEPASPWTLIADLARPLNAITGTSPDDVWAVGDRGVCMHWDGQIWRSHWSGIANDLHAIWAFAPDDVWAAGDDGALVHWDGKTWSRALTHTTENLRDLWGYGPYQLWAVGDYGTVLTWQRGQWSPVDVGTNQPLHAIWGVDTNHIWVAGFGGVLFYDGSQWTEAVNGDFAGATDLWGAAADDLWVGGSTGMLHYDGSSWGLVGEVQHIEAVWGNPSGEVWAAGRDGIFHWDGTRWTKTWSAAGSSLRGIWSPAPGDGWAVGSRQLLRLRPAPPATGP